MSLGKRRGVLIFSVFGLVGVIVLAGLAYYQDTKEKNWACLQRIEYAPKGYYLLDDERRFKTQDEALEYCLLQSPKPFTNYSSSSAEGSLGDKEGALKLSDFDPNELTGD